MTLSHCFGVNQAFANQAWIQAKDYNTLYQQSLTSPDTFWAQMAQQFLTWYTPWDRVHSGSLAEANVRWFEGATLNVSVNCIDKHLPSRAHQTAILWQGDEPHQHKHITYQMLHDEVCRMSNALKALGVTKGDRVCIYLPMCPEAAYAMLACARIGAIHSVVFGGFSPKALAERINDAKCQLVITANFGLRGNKSIPLKDNIDEALLQCPQVQRVLLIAHTDRHVNVEPGRDVWWHEIRKEMDSTCQPEIMDAEDPLFILYTSGSTGKPKGLLHTTAGYLLFVSMSFRYVFDYHDGDIFWCSADVGWITGHSYLLYGPLCNGATTVMFAGIPTYPSPARFWEIIDTHKVSIFYTAPTAIRALMREGDSWLKSTHRKSLRLIGTVGEPINPEVWEWYHRVVGQGRCPVVDTWWQTETGGMMIAPFPGATDLKPGSAQQAMFGVLPALLDEAGNELSGASEGRLVIKQAWPGMARSIYGDHLRYINTYIENGYYVSGDGAKRDEEGDYWITGRIDDVINVSGHRLGTAEIESALLEHPDVCEAAVVGMEHDIKGQGIHAFVTLKANITGNDLLKDALIDTVKDVIGAIAKPDVIQWAQALPKTRSGKIMRRILRKIAACDTETLGDLSTLANPEVVTRLIQEHSTGHTSG